MYSANGHHRWHQTTFCWSQKRRVQHCTVSFKEQWGRNETVVLERTATKRLAGCFGGKNAPLWLSKTSFCKMTSDLLSGSNIHRSSKILCSHDSVAQGHPGASHGGQSWRPSAPKWAPPLSDSPVAKGLCSSPEHPDSHSSWLSCPQ